MSISVCMATYNGERFIRQQLRSILDQLKPADEIVIVDDCSTDGTLAAIRAFADPRIRIFVNDRNRREVYSFGRSIELSRNGYIFLSDQDDVWMPGRVSRMVEALQAHDLVTTNFEWIDANGESVAIPFDGVRERDSARHCKNIADIFIGKTNYFGCAMAFRRGLMAVATPIPDYVESHDLWIALAANLRGSNVHLENKTLLKRRHGGNVTSVVSTRPLYRKLRSRATFARSLFDLALRHRPVTPIEKFRTG